MHNLIEFIVDFLENVQWNSKTFDDHTVFPLSESHTVMSHPKFDQTKNTVLYLHGYVEAPSHQSVHVIVEAYQMRDDYNILVLDWNELADGNFFVDAVPNIKQVFYSNQKPFIYSQCIQTFKNYKFEICEHLV